MYRPARPAGVAAADTRPGPLACLVHGLPSNPRPLADDLPDRARLRDDPDAHADLFRRLHAPLVRYARRIVGEAAAAEDVVQDVFLTLWRERERLAGGEALQSLLYTMVRNRSFNATRRRRWHGDAAAEPASDAPAADLALDADGLRRRLHAWIDRLPPRRGEAFSLSRFHGLRHAEIAAVMGLSERTVNTHILLALRELRGRLDALDADAPRETARPDAP